MYEVQKAMVVGMLMAVAINMACAFVALVTWVCMWANDILYSKATWILLIFIFMNVACGVGLSAALARMWRYKWKTHYLD